MMPPTMEWTEQRPNGHMATSIWVKAAIGTHPWPCTKSAHYKHDNEATADGRRYTVPNVKSTSKFGLAGTGVNAATVKRGQWPNDETNRQAKKIYAGEYKNDIPGKDTNSRDTDSRGHHATQAQRPDAPGAPDPGPDPGHQGAGLPLQSP